MCLSVPRGQQLRQFHHATCATIPSEAISCTIILEEEPALSEPHNYFPYVGLIFHNKKLKTTLPPMFWFPPTLYPWGDSLLNELTEVKLWCSITAATQPWLQPTSDRGQSQWLPDLGRDSTGPAGASSRRGNKDDTNQGLCLPDKCISLGGVLKKNTHRVNFFERFFFPEILNLPQLYSSAGPAAPAQPSEVERAGEAIDAPGHHRCPWQSYAKGRGKKLSQWTPQKLPDRRKVMQFREFRTKELPTFNTVKAVSFEIHVLKHLLRNSVVLK